MNKFDTNHSLRNQDKINGKNMHKKYKELFPLTVTATSD